jgi:hypothetical protein
MLWTSPRRVQRLSPVSSPGASRDPPEVVIRYVARAPALLDRTAALATPSVRHGLSHLAGLRRRPVCPVHTQLYGRRLRLLGPVLPVLRAGVLPRRPRAVVLRSAIPGRRLAVGGLPARQGWRIPAPPERGVCAHVVAVTAVRRRQRVVLPAGGSPAVGRHITSRCCVRPRVALAATGRHLLCSTMRRPRPPSTSPR